MTPEEQFKEIQKTLCEHSEAQRTMNNTMIEMAQAMAEMKMAVIGSEKLGIKGIVQKVQENSEYIDKDKKTKYTLTGIWLAASFVLFWIADFLKFKLSGGVK